MSATPAYGLRTDYKVAHNLKLIRKRRDSNPMLGRDLSSTGGRVSDNSRTIAATIVGAVIGGIAGYLFFTENGKELRRQFEPALDDLTRELNSFRSTFEKAAGVATEGWKVLNEALGEGGGRNLRYSNPHQTSPF
jgi:hypothetical protein